MTGQIDKCKVALSFSKAAQTYDSAAGLQREVGEALLNLVDQDRVSVGRVLDLGCGTGYFSEHLARLFGINKLTCLDLAQGMLQYARTHRALQGAQWLCADAEALPCKDDSLDIIFSSLAIQWCENLSQLFSEIARTLVPGGVAYLATLGPDSLFELREAWSTVDGNVHVNRFFSIDQLRAQIPQSLEIELLDSSMKVMEYQQLRELTNELKKIGAHNMNAGESKGLTGRKKIEKFKQNYEQSRQKNGCLPASYEVVYIVLRRV